MSFIAGAAGKAAAGAAAKKAATSAAAAGAKQAAATGAKKAAASAATSAAKDVAVSGAKKAGESVGGSVLKSAGVKPAGKRSLLDTASSFASDSKRPSQFPDLKSVVGQQWSNTAPKRPNLPQHHPAMQARNGQQEPQQSAYDVYKAKQDEKKQDKKDLLKSAVTEGVSGAADGASMGALPGAIIGAAAGVIKGSLKTKLGRRIIVVALLVGILGPIISSMTLTFMIAMASSAVHGADSSSARTVALKTSGVTDKDVADAVDAGAASGLPWEIILAYKTVKNEDVNAKALKTALRKSDPSDGALDLTAGAVYSSTSSARGIGKSADSKAAAKKVQTAWVTALQTIGLSEPDATTVFQRALIWAMGQENGCGSNATAGNAGGQLPALTDEQTTNADGILGMAKTMFPGDAGVQKRAATIAIQVAMVEHGLQSSLNSNGDNTYVGMFQQIAAWGTVAQRQDPAYASATFFNTVLRDNPTWASMDQPTLTLAMAHQQFGTGQPDSDYQSYANKVASNLPQATAIVTSRFANAPALVEPNVVNKVPIVAASSGGAPGGTVTNCSGTPAIGGTSQQIAQLLVGYTNSGQLTYWAGAPFPIKDQIGNIANGTASSACQLAPSILKLIASAIQTFGSVQINDLNRHCSGETTHADFTPHYTGNAVDFGSVGGHVTTGDDAWSVQLIQLADTVLPVGSGAGQEQCRPYIPGLRHITRQFDDDCSHQHIDIGRDTVENGNAF